jgi:hypothetical protein
MYTEGISTAVRKFKLSVRHWLAGAFLAIWCAMLSGVMLRFSPPTLLALHLVSNVGGVVPVAFFLGRHWWERRGRITHHPNSVQGHVALACLIVLSISGLMLIRWTNAAPLRWLHSGAMFVLLFDLSAHVAWRLRMHATAARRSLAAHAHPMIRWLSAGLAALCMVGSLAWFGRDSTTRTQVDEIPIQHASLGTNHLAAAQDCVRCHGDQAQQWRISGHAQAASDAYYQAVVSLFIEERGVEAVRYCAACHNPVGLMQGEVDASAAGRVSSSSGSAYQARKLGISLPISERAAEGVTCVICHQAAKVNGSLSLDAGAPALPVGGFDQLSLRADPSSHRDKLLPSTLRQAELCGDCHNLQLPNFGPALEPTFDEWLDSPYPARGVTCQTCHFSEVQARKSDSSAPESIPVHGGLPGAPSSLPGLSSEPALLRTAATLDARLTRTDDPSVLLATVTITNSGAGHHLPTGANDLRQVWLEATLRDEHGQVVWRSGGMDQYGRLDSSAVQFHKVLGDDSGRPIGLHRIWAATRVLSDTSLKPLEVRQIPFRIVLAQPAPALCTLTVRLLYRDVSQAFAEFALNRAVSDLPVLEMVRTDVELGILGD